MAKFFTPLNLKHFRVQGDAVPVETVISYFRDLRGLMLRNQEAYGDQSYDDLANLLVDGDTQVKGSLNSLGRSVNMEPIYPTEFQSYNFAEMFRVSMLSKMGGYLQRKLVTELIISQPSPTPDTVKEEFQLKYPNYKTPRYHVVKALIERIKTKGITDVKTPARDGVLPFWAQDTHCSKLTHSDKEIFFTIKLPETGKVTLIFDIPRRERFNITKNHKISRPNVTFRNGKPLFCFSVINTQEVPVTSSANTLMGVDLGVVEPFTATIINKNTKTYTPAYTPNKRIKKIAQKIEKLKQLQNLIWIKEEINKQKGHSHKEEKLKTERLRVKNKISRLKTEQAHHIANQIVTVAEIFNATIILEDLAWTPKSKWDHSQQQEAIKSKATKKGIKTRTINPAYTSQTCPKCQTKTTKSTGRKIKCETCYKKIDRDIAASRNIPKVNLKNYKQSTLTRKSKPVTPGQITNYDTKTSYQSTRYERKTT